MASAFYRDNRQGGPGATRSELNNDHLDRQRSWRSTADTPHSPTWHVPFSAATYGGTEGVLGAFRQATENYRVSGGVDRALVADSARCERAVPSARARPPPTRTSGSKRDLEPLTSLD